MSGSIDHKSDLEKRLEELKKRNEELEKRNEELEEGMEELEKKKKNLEAYAQLLHTTVSELSGEDNSLLPATSVPPHPGPVPNTVMPLVAALIADNIQPAAAPDSLPGPSLSKGGFTLKTKGEQGVPLARLLMEAIRKENQSDIRRYLAEGADITYREPRNLYTALHKAVNKNCTDITRILLEAGAPIQARDECGYTPLHLASVKGHLECLQVLVACGGDPNARDVNGQTPLHLAASEGHRTCVQRLLQAGADISIQDKNKNTPTAVAAISTRPLFYRRRRRE